MDQKKQLLGYLDDISVLIVGVFFLLFPIVFTSQTTDAFTLPKQIVLTAFVIISVVLFAAKMLADGKVRFRTTPFDLPLGLLILITFASSVLAVNRFDALIAFVPLFFAILSYFIIVNTVRSKEALLFVVACLVGGGVLASVNTILSFFKIYLLPFAYAQTQVFSPFGSLLDQAIFLGLTLPLAGYLAYPLVSGYRKNADAAVFAETPRHTTSDGKTIAFGVAFIVLAIGLLTTVYMLVTLQKPLILPFETGFQTAFASISQDAGRVLQSFLLGSGYGTYMVDFTRFKAAGYNLNPDLWSFTFFRSSSFVLELLATTGLLGVLAFLFLIYRVLRERFLFIPMLLAIIASFLLPFSFTIIMLFFVMLAVFAIQRGIHDPARFSHVELYFVTLKKGLVAAKGEDDASHVSTRYSAILPILFLVILVAIIGTMSYYAVRFIISDVTFQRSLVAASQNNGGQTYQLQREAIAQFPYRDAYYRIFSQTNLALANSLVASQPQGSSPSAEVQQNVLTLIQQSINAGRTAVNISPQSSLDWNNLSAIYRALIGFGENADRFAILTNQQAAALDPNNPQQYINLGGIYYQLGAWDEAQRQFQIAINLKPDYANAYYNLGHALESKGDLQNAVQVYNTVKSLVQNDPENFKKISDEITALQAKIGNQANTGGSNVEGNAENQPDLDVDESGTQLPERDPREEIPAPPSVSITPTPAKGTPTPAKASPTPRP